MALRLATTCLVLATVIGCSSAARSNEFSRSLLQSPPLQSAMCGSQGYIVGQSFCVYIPTGTGVAAWICPVDQSCACPTKQTGRNPFDCYNPSQYSCSTTSPNWPQSGLIKQLGISDAGACGSAPATSAPSMAPVPAPAPGPGPGGAPMLASAPISEPAPAM